MTAESDKAVDKILEDSKSKFRFSLGDEYTYNGNDYIYGEHILEVLEIAEQFPHCMHANNCVAIVNGKEPKTTQGIKELNRAALAAQVLANPAVMAAATSLMSAIPGVDKAIEAVKGVVKQTAAKIPGKSGPASDIVNKITQVNTLMKTAVASPAGAIFSQVTSQLMQGIPSGGTGAPPANSSSLQQELQKLMALANDKKAYVAQFNRMTKLFPQVDINKLVAMASNAINNKNPQALMAAIPQMLSLAGGAMKMLGGMGGSKHPDKLPQKEKKIPPKEKAKPLVQPKNLFAPAAGGGNAAALAEPVSSLLGIASTVIPNLNQISPSAQKTSAGEQKLTATANTTSHGSGQYEQIKQDDNAVKMLELAHQIEVLQNEIDDEVDLETITTKTEAQLKEIYPALNETTTVLELLVAIREWEDKKIIEEEIERQA